ncbi:hypothetical protein HHE02_11280 [Helicobacter heilmannii]|nr:hypothetical protein ASB1_09800 [Helicobacter heilmannii]CRF45299.1 hypothetical protein HHE014_02600 [Helicobacter heilmannii]CRF47832.1 hypothetical protein HHE02_11280 [Helicobacter heilmannii]CRF49005.1 hypothetical protein HHE03_06010 [Helicobacter heilmannii]
MRATQYSEGSLNNYLGSIGLGSQAAQNLTPTEALGLYYFNQALTSSNVLIAGTQAALQQDLSTGNYNGGNINA